MATMPGRDAEMRALIELARRADVGRTADAPSDLARYSSERAAAAVESMPVVDPLTVPVVCLLWRLPLTVPDNKQGHCADCGAAVQYRPQVPESAVKLCAFCALAREAGSNA